MYISMESADSSAGSQQQPNLPPGFRFHPTDEELVVEYLKKKAASAPLPVAIIADVDLYKFDPWELPAKASFGEQEWYFFSPRDRKYPNGARPNRAATSGYWKATGTDKPVLSTSGSGGTQKVGVKKALVFYGGKPPKGIKTNWIMHEYRLIDNNKPTNMKPLYDIANKKGSLRLDDWVLCRIYKKNNSQRAMDSESCDCMSEMIYASIPGARCIHVGQEHQKLPSGPKALTSTSYGAMLENEQNMLQNMMNNSDGSISLSGSSNSQLLLPSPNVMSMKRALFWDEDSGLSSSNKRFLCGDHQDRGRSITLQDGTGSMANLLGHEFNQSAQVEMLQQQGTILANLGDGGLRQPSNYQLPAGLIPNSSLNFQN